MSAIIISMLLLNAISFTLVAVFNKHLSIKAYIRGSDRATTYLIGDELSNERLFEQLMLDDNAITGTIKLMSFQNFGFNPMIAAAQLRKDVEATKASDNAPMTIALNDDLERPIAVISSLLGSEVPIFVMGGDIKHIAVDPCFGCRSLRTKNVGSLQWLSALLQIVVFLLGWLSYVPIIKYSKSGRCSLALYADMFYWTVADVKTENGIYIDGLVVNEDDKNINSEWLFKNVILYDDACISVIRGKRAEYAASITEIWHRIR